MIAVLDSGRFCTFFHEALTAYHGPEAPGGVAHAVKIMERAFPILSPDAPPERREITIRTAFRGAGVRDAFELVTRAVTGGRYDVAPAHAGPADLGDRAGYVFHLGYRDRAVSLVVRDGIVRQEFLTLAAKPDRSADEEIHLAWLKQEMADRIMALHASAVYGVMDG
ncbi:MAG: hypothetical protein ACK5IB_05285 [Qingshengfaniella sp.]